MVTFWPSRVILDLDVALGHSRRVFFFFFVANIAFTRFFVANVVITCFLG